MEKQKIFHLLQKYRLEKFYCKFVELGVETEEDFLDSITEKNLEDMGFSQVEKNRFSQLTEFIKRLGTATGFQVMKSLQVYQVYYTFPGCQEYREITGMDPNQNTVEDLMLRICHQENVMGTPMSVCLFTAEGVPLTDDPFFNTWSLKDRHIDSGSKLYAIFTPKENLRDSPQCPRQNDIRNDGPDIIRCHIMLKRNYEIRVDLEENTLADLRTRLSLESGIPAHVLYPKDDNYSNYGETLKDLGISEDETVHFILSTFHDLSSSLNEIFHSNVKPSVPQSQKGLSIFFSTLQAIAIRHSGDEFKKVVAYIRKLSGCNALAQSLYQLICKATTITHVQKIAAVEGLYFLFREMLPSPTKRYGEKIIEDEDVFEHAAVCWAYLLSEGGHESSEHEIYAPISLKAQSTGRRFSEPVRVPGVPEVFDREYVLEKIKDGEKIPNCTEENLREASLQRATDIEKILLSLPPSTNTFPLWVSYDATQPSSTFRIYPQKTYAQMNEELAVYPHISVTPPLQLRGLGVEGPLLVYLSEDNLGMYIGKDKATPQNIKVFDCLAGKEVVVNVDELANKLRDITADLTFRVTKTPKEAIVVLFDSSSSMSEECFDAQCQMKRIDAIKQMFDSFSNRCMSYNFDHVICLVKFDSKVKTLHIFTENMETFKEYVHGLQASGRTLLYDALNHGSEELAKVKARFPDCRCRILCLTDGNDIGSSCTPVDVAKKLMTSNIVVDAVIVGKVDNTVLHGISNVTGGCCFKPETSKAAMKLFEMETVLSMELRKEKQKFDVSSITNQGGLKKIFQTHPYDEKPQTKLPPQINNKVTVTQNVLKKKIMESKSGRFMEKDKRILEELKSLHCDPHPYCNVLPSESDINFWKILLQGPPETPYENGVFELYCEFGPDYPVKPPLLKFITAIYHCNVNSVGRICHNIFDRNYSAQITMREILDAVFGLLIAPEPEDPLDSILAEEFMTSKTKYEEEARKNTENNAIPSMDEVEKKYVPEISEIDIPPNLKCSLTKKLFVDPVRTKEGYTYERKAIEKHLKGSSFDPLTNKSLSQKDLKEDKEMKKAVQQFRRSQIQETTV
ncbi:uncharacterized protein LOC118803045 [Colossoma macropomum]|uniref:uncharacterized protein LOC118803045 n=1 Tax=Colossoma macropomum TaxID=42526 RepID=UPI0018642613|nr:uncharacterized protein LOC118803045 [Colossoma macropomum]XP_036419434.1 uncharacterized protein LOC118803045 [Colossoma macropomum]